MARPLLISSRENCSLQSARSVLLPPILGSICCCLKLWDKKQWNIYPRQNGVGTISATLTTYNDWHTKLHFVSCTKRRQTDLLRFGKKRETLNPWSGHGGRREASVFETLIPCWFWEASVLQSFPEPSSASTPHRTLHHLTKPYKRLHHHMCACAS